VDECQPLPGELDDLLLAVDVAQAAAAEQGLTLVNLSAQRKRCWYIEGY
jgi:hypothetical protein